MAVRTISDKIEQFIVERSSFRDAVKQAFHKADLDGNGVLSPKEVAAMTDTVFDHMEKELNDYGVLFKRPTEEQVLQFLETADANHDFVLNEEEFFDFYRQVVKYCAVVAVRGVGSRYLPMMLLGFVTTWAAKLGVSRVPSLGDKASSILGYIPEIIVGPLLGCIVAYHQGRRERRKVQKELFPEGKKKKNAEASTSTAQG